MSAVLWINQDQGGCTCVAHAGRELTACLNARPKAKTHQTQRGCWLLVNDDDRAFWMAEMGSELDCEVCEQDRRKARPHLRLVK